MEIVPLEGPVPFGEVRRFLVDPHTFTMLLNLPFDLGCFSFVQLLSQFIPNLEERLFWFLAFWDLAQVLLPGLVDFLLQLRILKFVQVCLPGLHDFRRRA
jgi:hypothetical protein